MKNVLFLITVLFISLNLGAQNNSKIDSLMQKANIAFKNNKLDTAQNLYKKVIKLDTNFINAYYNLAMLEYSSKRYKNAISLLKKCQSLGDLCVHDKIREISKYINDPEYLSTIDTTKYLSFTEVDEYPLFIYKGKPCYFMKKDKINPRFINQVKKLVGKIKVTKDVLKYHSLYFNLRIDKNGRSHWTLLKKNKFREITHYTNKVEKLLSKEIKFIPAKYKGKSVGVDRFTFPLGY